MLAKTYELVKAQNFELVNADCTLLLQRPKIAPYILSMREALAQVLDTTIDRVSVKATTTEGAGFVGREEGVAAYSTVLLKKVI